MSLQEIAEELSSQRKQISIAEFFEQNKQMLGFDSDARALVTAVKEGVDNSLDATEEAGILPDIYVEVKEGDDYYTVIIEDNGPGITKDQIPKVFGQLLYGSRFHARSQSRGQQGIGISAAVLNAQLTSGKPTRITSQIKGEEEANYFELRIDTENNKAEIQKEETVSWDKDHGTKIEMEMEANMRSRTQLHDYIKHTAVVNPHASIEFKEPQSHVEYERAADQLPEKPEEIKPHPHGVELGAVMDMMKKTNSYELTGFLQNEFTRVGQKTAEEIVDNFKDYQYGREMGWRLTAEEEEVFDCIDQAVSQKSAEGKEYFTEQLFSEIKEGYITHTHLENIVQKAADSTEKEKDERFGDTVRENSIEAIWDLLKTDLEEDIYPLVDDATDKRKHDKGVQYISAELATFFREQNHRSRATRSQLEGVVVSAAKSVESEVDEKVTFGEKSRDKIVKKVWSEMETVDEEPPKVKNVADNRDVASNFVKSMHSTNVMAPPTKCLSPISEELIKTGMKTVFDAEFYAASTRDASVYSGEPFVVEAGIAYGGDLVDEGKIELTRFANRVPLVYQRGACSITDVVKNIGWRNYKLKQSGGHGIPEGPAVLLIHVASTNVPFTSEAKDAVANIPEIEYEIERAVREAARELKSYLKKQQTLQQRQKKENLIAKILPVMSEKAAGILGEDTPDITGSQARIMNSLLFKEEDGAVTVQNFSNKKEKFTVNLIFEEKPTYPSKNTRREETEDGWKLVWDGKLSSGESTEFTWNDAELINVDIDGIAEERYTSLNNLPIEQ